MSNRLDYKLKMEQYKKAGDKLESYEIELNEYIDMCLCNFREFHNVYQAEANLQGEVMDSFNSSSENFDNEVKRLLTKIEEDINIINNRKSRANTLYEEYKVLYGAAFREDLLLQTW